MDRQLGRVLDLGYVRVGLALLLVLGTYVVVADPVHRWEGEIVFRIADAMSGSVHALPNPQSLLIDSGGDRFVVRYTTSCSVAALVASFVPASLLLLRAPLSRRLLALVIGAVVAAVVNAGRVVGLVIAGSQWGRSPMIAVHDWLGVLLTAGAGVLGLVAMISVTARLDADMHR